MKRLILYISYLLMSLQSGGQSFFMTQKTITCPTAVTFNTVVNITESPTGTFALTSAAADGNAKGNVSLAASTNGTFQSEYQSAQNTFRFALCWDVSNSIATSYYATAAYVIFVFSGNYWYNDNQGGSVDTGVPANDGDLFQLTRTSSTIKAQYFRSSAWIDLITYTTTTSAQIFCFISASNNGSTILKSLNPKQCGMN